MGSSHRCFWLLDDVVLEIYNKGKVVLDVPGGGYWTRSDEFCEYPLLEKLHFHVALEEVRVTELLRY